VNEEWWNDVLRWKQRAERGSLYGGGDNIKNFFISTLKEERSNLFFFFVKGR
jgi:hypothetical protein